jgi:hypothetical protein
MEVGKEDSHRQVRVGCNQVEDPFQRFNFSETSMDMGKDTLLLTLKVFLMCYIILSMASSGSRKSGHI